MSQASESEDLIAPVIGSDRYRADESSATRVIRRRRPEILAVALGFALLTAACCLAAFLAWEVQKSTSAMVDARQARRAGTAATQALLGAESSQRGFLLTQDAGYLAPYGAAADEFARSVAEMRVHLAGDPTQLRLADEVGHLGAAKFAELNLTLSQARNGQFDAAIATMRSGNGKELMDAIRHDIDTLNAAADDAVMSTTATQARVRQWVLGAVVVALVCVGGVRDGV